MVRQQKLVQGCPFSHKTSIWIEQHEGQMSEQQVGTSKSIAHVHICPILLAVCQQTSSLFSCVRMKGHSQDQINERERCINANENKTNTYI